MKAPFEKAGTGLAAETSDLKKFEPLTFFDAGKDHNVALTIATGEQRL